MNRTEISPPPSKRGKLSGSQNVPAASFPEVLRTFSWNVNGIQPFLQRSITSFFGAQEPDIQSDTAEASLRGFLRRHGWPTILFLQEVKVSPEDAATIRAVEKAVRVGSKDSSSEPDYVAYFCLPSDKFNARGFGRKVYGVCSIIRKDFFDRFVDRIRPVSWDTEGRFLVTETKAIGNWPKLALINAYMVNGTENPYKNTVNGRVTGTRHDRKLQVHRLLEAAIRELQAKGFGIILAGDMNVARSAQDACPNLRMSPPQHCLNRADFEARFFSKHATSDIGHDRAVSPESDRREERLDIGLGMIDTFRFLHPDKRGYTYHPRGRKVFGESCDRVDMIIISASLEKELTEAGMHETPGDRGPSDHVPLYARFAPRTFSTPNRDDTSGVGA
ncbi:hypothetical protein LTR36_000043 [Oleoguttula mirabilis]|uniref:Endonuclease/exonuclease/phosphatase domain-containing protein n=1 Tax=Oleoguttula mirabilis TaxID=1507867 RepID=A0AAV9JXT9_9PEZI|nr:hypothetical protein LTR36_000043 [Oleoguttula mirabilis]